MGSHRGSPSGEKDGHANKQGARNSSKPPRDIFFPSTSSAQLREGGGVCTYDGMIAHAGGLLSEKKSSMTSRKAMEAENKAKPAV